MGQNAPELLNMLKQARESVDLWAKQPALAQVLSHVSVKPEKPKIALKDRWVNFKNGFIENFIDDADPLGRVSEKLGLDRHEDNSPYNRVRMVRGLVDSVSQYSLGVAQTNFEFKDIGKSFDDILAPLKKKKQLNEFIGYLTAERSVELTERGIETGIPLESAKAVAAELRPKYETIAKELYQFEANTLQYAADSGILLQDAADAMLSKNQKYVPFRRVLEENYDKGVGVKKLKPKNPLKGIKGSTRDIENPLENIIKNTYQIIANAEKNRVALAVADLSKLDKSGEFVFKVTKNAEKYVSTLSIEKKRMHFGTILDNSFWQNYQSVINYKNSITGLQAYARTVQQSNATANEKRQQLDSIYKAMNETAKAGLELNKAVEKSIEDMKKSGR